jgi:hypothetical protein
MCMLNKFKSILGLKKVDTQKNDNGNGDGDGKGNHPHPKKDRVLFILKDRVYQKEYSQSYGLYNSAKMVMNYLESTGNICKIVTVIDGNFIDAEVFKFKPSVVVIEALWVTGAKMKELTSIHRYKDIKWVIRVHSDIGFLSVEARGLKYIHEYLDINNKNIIVSCNNEVFNKQISDVCKYNFKYLPNIITIEESEYNDNMIDGHEIHIGSFGALRIMKNQVYQAMCAISAADEMKKTLHFHVNGDILNPNNPVLLNMQELFDMNGKHHLHVHGWLPHDDFEDLIRKMDIGLQISFTESFNIVTADFVLNNVPIIVSDSITWMPEITKASETMYYDVIKKIIDITKIKSIRKIFIKTSKLNLINYNIDAKIVWNKYIK